MQIMIYRFGGQLQCATHDGSHDQNCHVFNRW